MQRLRANRDLMLVKLTVCGTTTETTMGEQRIEAGKVLLVWIASANRDEAQFPRC